MICPLSTISSYRSAVLLKFKAIPTGKAKKNARKARAASHSFLFHSSFSNLKNKFFESCKKYEDEIEVNEFGHDRYVSIVTINLKHTDKAYAILELLMILNKKESDTIIFGDNYADINML